MYISKGIQGDSRKCEDKLDIQAGYHLEIVIDHEQKGFELVNSHWTI